MRSASRGLNYRGVSSQIRRVLFPQWTLLYLAPKGMRPDSVNGQSRVNSRNCGVIFRSILEICIGLLHKPSRCLMSGAAESLKELHKNSRDYMRAST